MRIMMIKKTVACNFQRVEYIGGTLLYGPYNVIAIYIMAHNLWAIL